MVWNIDSLIIWLEKLLSRILLLRGLAQVIIIVSTIVVILTILFYGGYIVDNFLPKGQERIEMSRRGETIDVSKIPYVLELPLALLILMTSVLCFYGLVYAFTAGALRFVKWIKSGRRERQVGIVGLFLLSVGFIVSSPYLLG
jgi:hypothetical protein